MIRSKTIKIFKSGTHNLLDSIIIPVDAASDSKNWITKDGRIVLSYGKIVEGADGVSGKVSGEIFGFKVNGSVVHYRKVGTKIQYDNAGTWTDVITGLTNDADYAFSNYSSLAGTFTFSFGVDGIYKMHNANPGSYISLYNATYNFKGKAFIDKGRTILWDRPEDKTGLYGSKIDAQLAGTQYTSVATENLGASGSTAYSGTLAFKGTTTRNCFNSQIYAGYGSAKTITAITQATNGQVTATAHGYAVGDKLIFTGVLGMTQINNLLLTVASVVDANNFTLSTNTSGFSAYSSAGSSYRAEYFTDSYLGTLSGSNGGTGTINYITGAYSVTFGATTTVGVYTNYQWEDSNSGGLTDFRKSATRIAGEGFQFPQDQGGDPILNVLIGPDGEYYSMKKTSAYRLAIDSTDLNADNNVFRVDIGISSYRGVVSTSKGILFMNLANPEKPEMTILQRNLAGDRLEPKVLFPQYSFASFDYSDCTMEIYDRYILVACKTIGSATNNVILLCDEANKTVDATYHYGRTFAKTSGALYMGSSIVQSVYKLFNGFDDEGYVIDNYWEGKDENLGNEDGLSKIAKLQIRGRISASQSYEVYANYDESGYELVGTVLGSASYVDYSSPQAIGSNMLGSSQIGGDDTTDIYPYFAELKLRKVPKFNTIKIKLVALGFGYIDLEMLRYFDQTLYEQKIPSRFRQKQNVSLDGENTGQPNP